MISLLHFPRRNAFAEPVNTVEICPLEQVIACVTNVAGKCPL